jgi:maltose O-acetyltransferase
MMRIEPIKAEASMWRMAVLRCIPGRIGCFIRNKLLPYKSGQQCTVWEHVQIDGARSIGFGDYVSINRYSILHGDGGITIGDHVLVGPRVTIYSQNHSYSDREVPIDSQGYVRKPVVIGSNVWIAANAIILPGVTIGDDVIVAAGSVVSRDVADGTIVAGNPAKVIREF